MKVSHKDESRASLLWRYHMERKRCLPFLKSVIPVMEDVLKKEKESQNL